MTRIVIMGILLSPMVFLLYDLSLVAVISNSSLLLIMSWIFFICGNCLLIYSWYHAYYKSSLGKLENLVTAYDFATTMFESNIDKATRLMTVDAIFSNETYKAHLDKTILYVDNTGEGYVYSTDRYDSSMIVFSAEIPFSFAPSVISFIMAHEICHIKFRDSSFLILVSKYKRPSLAVFVPALCLTYVVCGLLPAIIFATTSLLILPYLISLSHRLTEKRSDLYAYSQDFCAGGIDFFMSQINHQNKVSLRQKVSSIFSTHPQDKERLKIALKYLSYHPQQ